MCMKAGHGARYRGSSNSCATGKNLGRNHRGEIELDGRGKIVVPGFIDSHVHCESTLVTPGEFDRCVLPREVG